MAKKIQYIYLVITFGRGITNSVIACFTTNEEAQEFCKNYNNKFPEVTAITKEKAYVYKRILFESQPTQKMLEKDSSNFLPELENK